MQIQAETGKRPSGAPDVNAAVPRNNLSGNLLFVHDSKSRRKWLIDGGALISIIPPTQKQRLAGPTGQQLQAANGTTIACYGSSDEEIHINNKCYPFTLTVADVKRPILGADFLACFYLAPNHRDGTLINLTDFSTIPCKWDRNSEPCRVHLIEEANNPYYQLLDRFPELSVPSFEIKEPLHGVRHHIPTSCHPIQSKARPLPPDKLAIAKAELEKLCDLGICQRGKSEWASPLLVTPKPCAHPCTCNIAKPCGGWRVCGDYRRLNTETVDDKYPVKCLTDFNADLSGKTVFSKVDLLKGYHQIPVAEEDVKKTGVITPFGLFVFPRTPFGLKNAGQDFQRLMDEILSDIPHSFVYVDDILVASEDETQHLQDLEDLFKTLSTHGMVINRAKCKLGQTSLDFLGFKVDTNGVTPLEEKVTAIRETPRPTTIKELQRFLGMCNYYRRFIPKVAQHAFHLHEALKGKPKPRKLIWNDDCERSFIAMKDALAAAAMLRHPRPDAQLAITSDASKIAIGAVLEQRGPLGWEPLAFYSTKLQKHQRDWPPFDRELLAAFKSIRHFRHMVEGRTFTLYTDHESLIPALHKKSDPLTARQTYQLSNIAEHTTDIRYLEGKANTVADALSRPNGEEESTATPQPSPISAIDRPIPQEKTVDLTQTINAIDHYGINLADMAQEQQLDADFVRISRDRNSGLDFRRVDIGRENLIVDVGNGPARPFVPFSWRRRIFDTIHGLGHPGVNRTRQMIAAKFVWPAMQTDVARWAKECQHCQRAKITRHTTPNIGDFEVPARRFSHVHIDIVTMPESNGFTHLLTMIDRFTRWPAAVPIKDITAESVIDAFALGWVAEFGVPQKITSDRGSQFTSAIWSQLLKTWGIQHCLTTAYHPESNGMVERLHRRLKESLIALCDGNPHRWFWKLPMSLLALRTTIKQDIGASPADLVFGEGLSVPGSLLPTPPDNEDELQSQRRNTLANIRLEIERLQPTPTSAHRIPNVYIPEDLQAATHVFVRRGGVQPTLSAPYEGPFRVISRSERGFRVSFPGRGIETVAQARLKPAYVSLTDEDVDSNPSTPPSPPPPGRRPGIRTRFPQPTDRETRPTTLAQRDRLRNPLVAGYPSAPSSSHSKDRPVVEPQDDQGGFDTAGPSTAQQEPENAPDPPMPPAQIPPTAGPPPRRFFSNPSSRNFSGRRPRPDVSALQEILQSHVDPSFRFNS